MEFVAAILLAGGMVGFTTTLFKCRRRDPLRCCPRCAAVAVRATARESLNGDRVRVRQECGQCGTWRESVVASRAAGRQERRLDRDRTEIRCLSERLEGASVRPARNP